MDMSPQQFLAVSTTESKLDVRTRESYGIVPLENPWYGVYQSVGRLHEPLREIGSTGKPLTDLTSRYGQNRVFITKGDSSGEENTHQELASFPFTPHHNSTPSLVHTPQD